MILLHRSMRIKDTIILLANLAVADILDGAVNMPFSLLTLILEGSWVLGRNMCQLNAFTIGLTRVVSIHTLMFLIRLFE